jgi:hypothetical protein
MRGEIYQVPFALPAAYPKFITEAEYVHGCDIFTDGLEDEADIEERAKQYAAEMKEEFYNTALRYIYATDFESTEREIEADDRIILHSHEKMGYHLWQYAPSENVVIKLRTNFGYGSSSYFDVDVLYKGVLLPSFSLLTRYYSANAYQLCHSTRSYIVERDSWVEALEFICEVCNSASKDEKAFVSKWLNDEIGALLSGLRDIDEKPLAIIEAMHAEHPLLNHLGSVDNMLHKDCDMLERYPNDLAVCFKAEKLSSALDFVRSLQAVVPLYSAADDAIEEIVRLNREMFGNIEGEIAKQHAKIDTLNERLDPLTARWQEIEVELDEDPDSAETLIAKGRLDEKIDAILNEVVARDGLMKSLQEVYAKITKAGVLGK